MLTATYTLVALSVEQAHVRTSLQTLQKTLHGNLLHQSALTPQQVRGACDAVRRIYDNRHWRKLDRFVIPAIRKATREADQLLQDLDELGRAAGDAVGVLAIRLGAKAIDSPVAVMRFCAALEAFCSATLERLEREEKDLFPVARAVISGEAWFSIANAMLAHEAYLQDSKPARKLGPAMAAAPWGEAAGDYAADAAGADTCFTEDEVADPARRERAALQP